MSTSRVYSRAWLDLRGKSRWVQDLDSYSTRCHAIGDWQKKMQERIANCDSLRSHGRYKDSEMQYLHCVPIQSKYTNTTKTRWQHMPYTKSPSPTHRLDVYMNAKKGKDMIKSAGRYPAWELWKKHKRKSNNRWYISNGKVPSGNSLASPQHSEKMTKTQGKKGKKGKTHDDIVWRDMMYLNKLLEYRFQSNSTSCPYGVYGVWCMIYVPLRWIPTST